MRIALLTDGIWPYVLGGMQKHSYYLCKYLAQQEVYVDLFHYNRSSYDISSLHYFSDQERKYISSHVIEAPTSFPFPGHYIYNSYRHSKLIYEAIKDKLHLYDFIYTKGFTGWYLIDKKYRKQITCAPIGVKFHGYEMFQKPPDIKTRLQHLFLLQWPVRLISLRADVVFSYGGKISGIIRSLGVPDSKIFELPSGVEQSVICTEIKPTQGKINFLYLGRYERRKGIEELNEVINELDKVGILNKMVINFIGPIPVNRQIKNPSIIYHGEIRDRDTLQTLIRQNDVLLCPSWSEGMPNVILEAMANGLAVLATDVGATNVLVNSETGWLIESPKLENLLAAVKLVMEYDPKAIDQKKKNALHLIENNFTWEKLILKFKKRFIN
ncbi:MAG: glycosyltransferase family 4 protein [bacterium]|nr:glycosyltransferase family 4 protein [bacterium]